jgi:hypothetical protein
VLQFELFDFNVVGEAKALAAIVDSSATITETKAALTDDVVAAV